MTLMPDAVDSTCWVVIPLYNEATMIGGVIDELRTRVDALPGSGGGGAEGTVLRFTATRIPPP